MRILGSRFRLTFLLAAALLTVATALWHQRIAELVFPTSISEQDGTILPPGFWSSTRQPPPPEPAGTADPEERARLVSLPYLGGRIPASSSASVGVVAYDAERAFPGLNLYNSGHAAEARLLDMEGHLLHRWAYRFERAFPHVAPNRDTDFFRRVHLLPDGRLIAMYQTGGLIFLDRDSHLLGRCPGRFYNDFWVGEDGEIWTLGKEATSHSGSERLDDFLVQLRYRNGGEGCEEIRRISITQAFRTSPFADLLDPMAEAGDVLHANTVSVVERPGFFQPGHLLISLREVDLLAVVDPRTERVVWAQRGPWRAQHEPTLLETGRILLFDNRGGGRHSRLLELAPSTGRLEWTWSGSPPSAFYSPQAGTCARLANGNTLVTESVPGRAFELDPDGRVVWDFRTPHHAGPHGSLVAMLFEVQRLPKTYLANLAP